MIIGGFVAPHIARRQQFAGNIRHSFRDAQAKGGLTDELSGVEHAIHDSAHHGAGEAQINARANPERALMPAGIHQPALRIVLAQALTQHFSIGARAQRQEG